MTLIEHHFTCPYCLQSISMLLDRSVAGQSYIEDCEVCCRPIEVKFQIEQDEISSFMATSIEQ